MNYVNQIFLLGNLTRDPEIKYTNEGTAITEMGIAVNKNGLTEMERNLNQLTFSISPAGIAWRKIVHPLLKRETGFW